jgi:hypothetical protein
MKVILLVFLLGTGCCVGRLSAQEAGEVRYTRYARTEQNNPLFDETNPFSLYGMILSTMDQIMYVDRFNYPDQYDYKGMSEQTLDRLQSVYGKWEQVPGLQLHLGRQATVPMANQYGEDSVVFFPEGFAAYIYPVRDSIFLLTGPFDDIVIEEAWREDAFTHEYYWSKERVLLRKRLPGGDEPVVVLSFGWELLYLTSGTRFVPVPDAVSDSLEMALETFLANGERRFPEMTYHQVLNAGNDLQRTFFRSRNPGHFDEPEHRSEEYLSWLKRSGQDNGVYEKPVSWSETLVNQYGEDSLLVDYDQIIIVSEERLDTQLYVKQCFDYCYEARSLQYNTSYRNWQDWAQFVVVTKLASPAGEECIVYTAAISPSNEYSEEQVAAFRYERDNNPLRNYLRSAAVGIYPAFDWERLTENAAFGGERITTVF